MAFSGCRSSSSCDTSDSDNISLYAGLPPKPGKDQLQSANSILDDLPSPDADYYARHMSSTKITAFDCCDRSVNVWETLIPLAAASSICGQGLDVIAP